MAVQVVVIVHVGEVSVELVGAPTYNCSVWLAPAAAEQPCPAKAMSHVAVGWIFVEPWSSTDHTDSPKTLALEPPLFDNAQGVPPSLGSAAAPFTSISAGALPLVIVMPPTTAPSTTWPTEQTPSGITRAEDGAPFSVTQLPNVDAVGLTVIETTGGGATLSVAVLVPLVSARAGAALQHNAAAATGTTRAHLRLVLRVGLVMGVVLVLPCIWASFLSADALSGQLAVRDLRRSGAGAAEPGPDGPAPLLQDDHAGHRDDQGNCYKNQPQRVKAR